MLCIAEEKSHRQVSGKSIGNRFAESAYLHADDKTTAIHIFDMSHKDIDDIHAQAAENDKVVSDQQQKQALASSWTTALQEEKEKPVPQPQPLPPLEEPLILEASQPMPPPKQAQEVQAG